MECTLVSLHLIGGYRGSHDSQPRSTTGCPEALDNVRCNDYRSTMIEHDAFPAHAATTAMGLEQAAFLELQRLAADLGQDVAELLKPAGLSAAQYNVLRILRGAGQAGLPCGEIAARMISKDPDITRLLDRLEKRRLVTRARESGDRRVVTTRITGEARTLLAGLDEPVAELHRRQLAALGEAKLEALLALLREARGAAG